MRATWPSRLILPHLITLIKSGEQYKLRSSSSLCRLLQPPTTSCCSQPSPIHLLHLVWEKGKNLWRVQRRTANGRLMYLALAEDSAKALGSSGCLDTCAGNTQTLLHRVTWRVQQVVCHCVLSKYGLLAVNNDMGKAGVPVISLA